MLRLLHPRAGRRPGDGVIGALLLALASCVPAAPPPPAVAPLETPLDRFVRAPDPVFAWELESSLPGDGVTAHVLRLTSQRWLARATVDRPVWWHWLTVIVPDHSAARQGAPGLLYLAGGDNTDPPPRTADPLLARIARRTGTVVSELRMVPNQPLVFLADGRPREEDALIAFSWDRFLRGGGARWLPRLPMTKSAVRAMDVVTAFAADRGLTVDQFVVAGRSKRGWTAWTAAAVDDRVVGVVPLVIDLLNVDRSFQRHFQAYGVWSPAIGDYVELGIPAWLGSERFRELRRVVDPYEYRQRLTLPKLIINAAGDEFFLPDSSRLYFADLPGEAHLRYVPNSGHSLGASDADDTLLAFHHALATGTRRPRLAWTFAPDGSIQVRAGPPPPAEVRLWRASNPEARDFRISTLGPAWTSNPLAAVVTAAGQSRYVARVGSPATGWTAFFVEATWDLGLAAPLKLTTEVRVLPEELPHAWPPPGTAPGAPRTAGGAAAFTAE